MSLTKPAQADRKQTSLAYALNFYPHDMLGSYQKEQVYFHKDYWVSKVQLLQRCNEDRTKLLLPKDPQGGDFQIHWAFNNVPTEVEWEKMKDCSTFNLQYRISPLCSGDGRIVVVCPEIVLYK